MQYSKLDKLIVDRKFLEGLVDVSDYDVGVIIHQDETLNYVALTYDDYYIVYLSLYDDTRDYLVQGKADTLDGARKMATNDLDKILNNYFH